MSQATAPEERVLATLNADGSRRWLRPRLSTGVFWQARRVVAYLLIVVFVLVPYLKIGGVPVLRLDVANRSFHFFGTTFLPSDTLLMALLMVTIFVSIFLITALFGRVWCGWACPQTVYMEFLYRPIERFFDGAPGKKQKVRGSKGARRAMKYGVYLLCSLFLAHTFLAYFVGPEVWKWMLRPPTEHPVAFLIVFATTGLMMLDFGFFREQVCLVMCPYGRFQAALLDRHSMIVTYDEKRGEPRGKQKRRVKHDQDGDVHLKVVGEANGDCIDCHMCVTTCPTGIDIRDGLQMECIGCAQCIDACDTVMEKVGKPKGLIRYSSQAIIDGESKRMVRPRTLIYPGVLVVLVTVFLVLLAGKSTGEAQVLPRTGLPFYRLDSTGEVANQVRLRVVNRSDAPVTYTFAIEEPARLLMNEPQQLLQAGESTVVGFQIALPDEIFDGRDSRIVEISVTGDDGFEKTLRYRALGPRNGGAR
ncbi:MAG: cytochrome c oxidase accessory protein CcoG [Phycisphaerales bacterium]